MKRQACLTAVPIIAWCVTGAWGNPRPTSTPAASRPAAAAAEAPDTRVAKEIFDDLAETYEVVVDPIDGHDGRLGEVDWTNGLVYATGSAKAQGTTGQAIAMARRAARVKAARNSLLLARGFSTDKAGRFEGPAAKRIVTKGAVRGFAEASSEYDPGARTATVKLIAPLSGISGNATARSIQPYAQRWHGWGASGAAPARLIVIDARGVDFAPRAWPAAVSQKDEVVFSPADLAPGQLVSYVRMNAGAKIRPDGPGSRRDVAGSAETLASRALILRAVPAGRTPPTALVLDDWALASLAGHAEARRLWQRGKVIVVLASEPRP